MPDRNKGGRPAFEIIDTRKHAPTNTIDMRTVEALCRIGATHDEIAAAIGISPRTLENIRARNIEFREMMDRGHLQAKLSIRRRLVSRSEESDSCLIFLAKNYLGMSDKVQTEVSGKDGKAIEVKHVDASLIDDFLRQIEINAVNQTNPQPTPEQIPEPVKVIDLLPASEEEKEPK